MTPAGHISISYLFGRYFKHISITAIIIGGILPDIDFVFFFAPWFDRIHRVVTHNLTFLLVASAAGAVFFGRRRKAVIFASVLAGGLLHILFDSCADSNPSNGLGVAVFWPFSGYFFCPVNLFTLFGAGFNSEGWSNPADSNKNWNDAYIVGISLLFIINYFIYKIKNELS